MQILNVTQLPIYLPYDKAQVPFGDPLEGITCTSASPGVVTANGYAPVLNDLVSLTFLAGGSMPTGLTYGQAYYVVAPSGNTFSLSLTKGGAAINTSSTGASLVLHLLSGEVDGVTLPFKPGYDVLVENNSGGTLVLQGSPDSNTTSYGAPSGPSGFVTLVSLAAGQQALVNLAYDWIKVNTTGTLTLQQN